jgi:hypothetical protein
MDCEKFEQAMMDELYGELDELTSAAAKRHVAVCAKCASLLEGLRATKRVASLPMVEPPPELEERILTAARDMHKVVPFRSRLGNAVSVAGRWAMQPQAAVAVVFFVMLGGSVLLLRPAHTPKSAVAAASPPVTVTEQGAPAPAVAAPSSMAEPSMATALAQTNQATDLESSRGHMGGGPRPGDMVSNAKPSFAPPPAEAKAAGAVGGLSGGGASAAWAGAESVAPNADDLTTARTARDTQGCKAALAPFDRAIQRGRGTPAGWDALLEGALCRRSVGDLATARVYLQQLLNVDSHKDRARQELGLLDQQIAQQGGLGPVSAKAAPRAAPAARASDLPAATAQPASPPPAAGAVKTDNTF